MKMDFLHINKALLIEFNEIELPTPDIQEFVYNSVYKNENASGKRYNGYYKNKNEVNKYFENLIRRQVFPKIISEPSFRADYPFSLEFLIRNTLIGASLHKDELGWFQDFHIDNRTYVMAGAFHLQDSPGNGTLFYGENKTRDDMPVHCTPSMKNSGALWINNSYGAHSVDIVKNTERIFYLVHVLWNLDFSL